MKKGYDKEESEFRSADIMQCKEEVEVMVVVVVGWGG